ncbi:uncharacterized protein LOC113510049 isoform X2 [Galleria mellonella]|uniref:Uncharacterized protein LOC113510049 isoform X2 n=1 Tax=Galleria mellonella TaxID=7137 RepID=A0A6J3BYD6_GALME|nr:uncharacterized protein LOC113510049 isoform X2 [Galleria mellonella]
MTLIGAILKKAQSKESVSRRYSSPPPEIKEDVIIKKKKKLLVHKGKVDCWRKEPPHTATEQYYKNRMHFLKQVQNENENMYWRIVNSKARVASTASLRKHWRRNRCQILHRAQAPFVLFPPVPQQIVEDAAFAPPAGVKRPRVFLSLRIRNGAVLGDLTAELFTDVCPRTCELFLALLNGDGLGHGYVGTCFFRKVPNLYWSGGDVIHNSGYGCYAQRGRLMPIGAENYHFPHSMPGLLSMRVSSDDEVCGIFNITFKPLPQFDLRNVVFGRIIRPCKTYEAIRELGSPLSTRPIVEMTAARHRVDGRWVYGQPNTKI